MRGNRQFINAQGKARVRIGPMSVALVIVNDVFAK